MVTLHFDKAAEGLFMFSSLCQPQRNPYSTSLAAVLQMPATEIFYGQKVSRILFPTATRAFWQSAATKKYDKTCLENLKNALCNRDFKE
jgi:hypothetical protein